MDGQGERQDNRGERSREEARLEVTGDVAVFDALVEACEGKATELLEKDPVLAYAVAVSVLERVAARVDTGTPDSDEELGSVFVAQRAVVLDPVLDGLLRGGIGR